MTGSSSRNLQSIRAAVTRLGFDICEETQDRLRLQGRVDGQIFRVHIRKLDRLACASSTVCTLPDDLARQLLSELEAYEPERLTLRVYLGAGGAPNNVALGIRLRSFDPRSLELHLGFLVEQVVAVKRAFANRSLAVIREWAAENMYRLDGKVPSVSRSLRNS